VQLTDAIQKGLDNGESVQGIVLKGKRIDVGGWDYLWHLWEYYREMSDEELQRIINERIKLMNKLRDSEV